MEYQLSHRSLHTIRPKVLTVAAFDKFYPVAFYENGKWGGLEVELMREYAAACGLTLKMKRVTTFSGIWDLPRLGHADVSIGGISDAMGRDHKDTEWSMPYYYVKRSVLLLKDGIKDEAHWKYALNFAPVASTAGSTGAMDAKYRAGELMNRLTKSKGYLRDIPRLQSRKISGIMYGDQVSKSIMAKTRRKNLTYRTWDIIPTLVPLDGETFSFPTRLGSGVAVSLTAFMTHLADTGKLKKLCERFALQYPAPLPIYHPTKRNPHKKRKFTIHYPGLKERIHAELEDVKRHLRDSVTPDLDNRFHKDDGEREKIALGRSDVIDHDLFLNAVDTVLAWVARPLTLQEDNRLLDFVGYACSKGDAPLVDFKRSIVIINTEKAMASVRQRGNKIEDLLDVYHEIGKKAAVLVLQSIGVRI